jgi:GNAT superfamily N-acetyltransferase
MACVVRPAEPHDEPWIAALLREHWGGPIIGSRGTPHNVLDHPALIAEAHGARCGLLAYRVAASRCEVLVIDARPRFQGTGSALIEAVVQKAREARCSRVWLVTTNDNLDALRFYQRRGFFLAALHRGAIDEARRMKPTIPRTGYYGIPIRDEIALERPL